MPNQPALRNPATRLERSALFVPASRYAMIEKAARSAADAVVIDLEDAVAPGEKEQARSNLVRALHEIDFGPRLRIYRINGLHSPFAYRDLIEVVEAVGDRVDLVMVPKVHGPEDLHFVDLLLTQIELYRGQERPIGIEAQIESPRGFLYAREIAAATPRLECLIYGPGDYAAALRAPLASIGERDSYDECYPGHRWHAVMHTIVAAARAHGLRCIDGPFAGLNAPEALEQASRTARALGFDGKQCIHPAQLQSVNQIFSPLPTEVAWAEAVVQAYEEAVAQGRGSSNFRGTMMIDAANVRMAQVVLEQQQKIRARTQAE